MPTCKPIPLPTSGSVNGNRYDLFVMNTEVGITGIVAISARDRDDAIDQYERANPACAVISVLMPDH